MTISTKIREFLVEASSDSNAKFRVRQLFSEDADIPSKKLEDI